MTSYPPIRTLIDLIESANAGTLAAGTGFPTIIEPDQRKKDRARQMTANPAFQSWFKGSQVVDDEGLPLMCYHGTNDDIAAFKSKGSGLRGVMLGRGIYVTTNSNYARNYAAGLQGGNIIPVYVRALRLAAEGDVEDHIHNGDRWEELSGDDWFDPEDPRHIDIQDREIQRLRGTMGFDGIYGHLGGGQQIVLFTPWQVKSAYGNRGRFSPLSPNLIEGPAHD